MKKKIVFLGFLFLLCIGAVHAATNGYYYEKEDGIYSLCGGDHPGCVDVSFDTPGLTISRDTITYQDVIYYLDEQAQEEYDNSQNGTSNMFYYMKNDKYVLCEKENKCKTYTRDDLLDEGATIINSDRIILNNGDGPGVPGDIYYFNSSYGTVDENGNIVDAPGNQDIPLESSECGKIKEPLMFLGRVVLIVKILIPILIIVFGIIDFFHAIVGSKDDEIRKSAKSLLFRIVAGVIIFFIPTIISVLFSLISDFGNIKGEFDACQKCIFRVNQCK